MAMSQGVIKHSSERKSKRKKRTGGWGGGAQGLGAVTDPGELHFVVKWLAVMDV